MTTFYVGQRVRIVADFDGYFPEAIGLECVISSPLEYHRVVPTEMVLGYRVELPHEIPGVGGHLICHSGELVPILGGDGNQVVDWSACPWQPREEVECV